MNPEGAKRLGIASHRRLGRADTRRPVEDSHQPLAKDQASR